MEDSGKRGAGIIAACILLPILLIAGLLELILHGSFAAGTPEAELQAEYRQEFAILAGEYTAGAGLSEAALAEHDRNGGTACGKDYWEHFGSGPENWCCDFVYYCGDTLGYVGAGAVFGPYTAYCPTAWEQMVSAGGTAFSIYDAEPQPGDIVFYYNTGSGKAARQPDGGLACHIGIVINFDGGILRTVEGNAGRGGFHETTVRKCFYTDPYGETWDGAAVLGFIRPAYPSGGMVAEDLTGLVASFEGFSKYSFWDYQQWSVGYGTRVPDGKLADYKLHGITEGEARKLLASHLQASRDNVDAWVIRNGLELTPSQRDALTSLTYNIGPGWMSDAAYDSFRDTVLNSRDEPAVVQAFANICHAGGQLLPGLVERRICEAELFLTGQYVTDAAATRWTYSITGNDPVITRR